MVGFGFDNKNIIGAINKAAKDITDGLKGKIEKDMNIPFKSPVFDIKGATGGAAEAIEGINAKNIMGDMKKQVEEELKATTEKFKTFGEFLFNPLKAISKQTGKLMKKTFSGPKSKAMGGFMKNIGAMLGPIGIILTILEKLGVFEPILEIVNDLIEMLGAKILEKLMPSFEKLFDIMLSDDVMSLIDALAEIFAVMMEPLMELTITLLPVFLTVLTPLIGLLAELMPLLTLPSMIIAKLIATLVKLPGFQTVIEAIAGAIGLAATAIGGFVDFLEADNFKVIIEGIAAAFVWAGDAIGEVINFIIDVINDVMNFITAGLWEDIPAMGSEINEAALVPTAAVGGTSAIVPNVSSANISIIVEGDIMGEEMVDKLISEIELNTRLGMMI